MLVMKTLIFCCLMLSLAGCGSAQLVSTRYKPTKQGTIRMDIPGPVQKEMVQNQATEIMRKFCAPQRAQIIGTDTQTRTDGAYYAPYGGSGYVNYSQVDSPLIHFECVDDFRGSASVGDPKK